MFIFLDHQYLHIKYTQIYIKKLRFDIICTNKGGGRRKRENDPKVKNEIKSKLILFNITCNDKSEGMKRRENDTKSKKKKMK